MIRAFLFGYRLAPSRGISPKKYISTPPFLKAKRHVVVESLKTFYSTTDAHSRHCHPGIGYQNCGAPKLFPTFLSI
jgi:hypothetical protein